ncbi:bifunctional DNA primase/polymerase [Siccirubricoccus deserti]
MREYKTISDIFDLLPEYSQARTVTLVRRTMFDAGFPPVPVRNAVQGDPKSGKAPMGTGWQHDAREPVPPCCGWDEAEPAALSTGLLCDGLRVLDIDIDDRARADAAHEIAETLFGPSPAIRRRVGTGRRALLYRAAEGQPGKLVRVNSSTDERVEVLGRGQQLVAYGTHYSGAAISWQGLPGLEVERAELPVVTEEQIADYLDAVSELITADSPGCTIHRNWRNQGGAAGDG